MTYLEWTHFFKKPIFLSNVKISKNWHDTPGAVVKEHVGKIQNHGNPWNYRNAKQTLSLLKFYLIA